MHLIYESTTKDYNGIIEISVYIVNEFDNFKKYVYKLSSEYAVRRFFFYFRKGKQFHGIALSILNKFKIEKEK